MRVGCGVADGDETGKLIPVGGVDRLFHVFGLLFYRDVQRAGEPFGGRGQQDVFYGRPCGGEIVIP